MPKVLKEISKNTRRINIIDHAIIKFIEDSSLNFIIESQPIGTKMVYALSGMLGFV